MRIVFLNQKGGVGKTTLVLLLSSVLRQAGVDVAVDDRDPQGSARFFAERFGVPLYDPVRPTAYVVTDTAGNLQLEGQAGAELRELVATSDKLILVTEKGPAAMHGSGPMVRLIKEHKRADASARILFNRVRSGTTIGQQDGRAVAAHLGLPPLTVELAFASAYENALVAGLAAVTGKWREELLKLALEVTNK